MKKTSVIVVDDHKLVREMWSELFSRNTEIEVIDESGVFEEAINKIKEKRPDIVLLDINLAQASGFDAVPLIRKFAPASMIIAVSMHCQPAYAKKMLQLGAKGYVTKNSSRNEILMAVAEVMAGRKYVCEEIRNIISEQMLND
jgi:two-component system invasion response regulator UvrY